MTGPENLPLFPAPQVTEAESQREDVWEPLEEKHPECPPAQRSHPWHKPTAHQWNLSSLSQGFDPRKYKPLLRRISKAVISHLYFGVVEGQSNKWGNMRE